MADLLITAFVTFFVTTDPVGIAPMFLGLTGGAHAAERRHIAVRGVVIAGVILVAFAILGEALLHGLGIGLPAFRIAGGILLLLLAVDMVMVRQTGLRAITDTEDTESHRRDDISVFPLAIPLIAGPGALTSVVLLMARAGGDLAAQALVVAVLLAVLALTLACLLVAGALNRLLGVTGVNVVTRVAGIVLAALAVQFVIDGVLAILPAGGT